MRSAPWIGVTLVALTTSPLVAQSVSFRATVTAPEADVRAQPSDNPKMYTTNRLRRGDTVDVIMQAQEGFYGIRPPSGSFSWVHSQYVQQTPGRPMWWVINCGDYATAPVRLGSNINMDKPTIEGVKLKKGAQVRAVGPMKPAEDGNWLPIESPVGEVRYIRAADVSKSGEAPTARTAPSSPPEAGPPGAAPPIIPGGPPPLAVPTPGVVAPPPIVTQPAVAAITDPRWQRAAEAEQAGRTAEAIQLFRALGAEVRGTDQDYALKAFSRAQVLEDGLRRQSPAPPTTPMNDVRYPAVPNQVVSPPPPDAAPAGMTTSSPGVLQRAGKTIDNRPTYLLMNNQGFPTLYAVPHPSVSLTPYENRTVELRGTLQQRADLRAWLMVVSQVRVLQ